MTTLYGIKNCDTIKKARKWLTDNGIEYKFHDVRADGIDAASIENWIEQAGWETVLNRRGTTWRKLDSSVQESTIRTMSSPATRAPGNDKATGSG